MPGAAAAAAAVAWSVSAALSRCAGLPSSAAGACCSLPLEVAHWSCRHRGRLHASNPAELSTVTRNVVPVNVHHVTLHLARFTRR